MNVQSKRILIGSKIQDIRQLKGLTRKAMALDLNISHRSYSAIENGEVSITIDRLYEIAGLLEVDITTLLGFSSDKIFNQTVYQNEGNNGENINHKEVVNDISLINKLLEAKEQTISILLSQLKKEAL
jgi:transcriptional regulator with XRE-family HTH domain